MLNKNKFSIIVDESTDKANKKLLSIIARVAINFKVRDYFLGLIEVPQADAVTLHKEISGFFEASNIDYKKNLIGIAADGAAVMTGRLNSVVTKLRDDVPNIFIFKCICHSFALCSSYACKKLPIEIEILTRDIYITFWEIVQSVQQILIKFKCYWMLNLTKCFIHHKHVGYHWKLSYTESCRNLRH